MTICLVVNNRPLPVQVLIVLLTHRINSHVKASIPINAVRMIRNTAPIGCWSKVTTSLPTASKMSARLSDIISPIKNPPAPANRSNRCTLTHWKPSIRLLRDVHFYILQEHLGRFPDCFPVLHSYSQKVTEAGIQFLCEAFHSFFEYA